MTRLWNPQVELHVFLDNVKTVIANLDISFDIELIKGPGKKSNPNVAKISVWQLDEDTRGLLTEEYQALQVYAGHDGNLGLIFAGEITNVTHVKEPTSMRTDIIAGDGMQFFEQRKFARTYAAGIPVPYILTDMLSETDLPFAIDPFAAGTIADRVLLRSESYSGRLKDCLTVFCEDQGLQWSSTFGTIEVETEDSPFTLDASAVVFSPDTGMIELPQIIDRTNSRKKRGKTKIFGVRAKSLLIPEVKPGRFITINTATTLNGLGLLLDKFNQPLDTPKIDANGVYVADVVRYMGDNFGGDFDVEFEGDLNDEIL